MRCVKMALFSLLIASLLLSLSFFPVSAAGVDCTDTNTTGVPQAQCEALVDLYNSTGGAGWTNNTNWLTAGSIEDWYGITINSGVVSAIQLGSNNLVGQIPASLGTLLQVGILELQSNHLSGTIPPEIGGMGGLQNLNLSGNQLTGSIPASIFDISPLQYLYLTNNQLTGSLPAKALNSPSLRILQIYSNQLTGPLPDVTSINTTLTQLNLYGNQLSGPIPASISNLKALFNLSVSDNNLSGSIPAEIGQMTALKYLYLGANDLTGAIPVELFTPIIEEIQLIENKLTGPIPGEIANAVQLTKFFAGYNYLTGPIPDSIGNLSLLQRIWIDRNDLYGPVPDSVLNLTNLMSSGILLSSNGLWTTNVAVQTLLNGYDSSWSTHQGPQGLLPAEGGHVGWGDLSDSDGFTPVLRFSKHFNNNGMAALVYLVEVFNEQGTSIMQKVVDGTDTAICPDSGPQDPPVACEFQPRLSDFSAAPVVGEQSWRISAAFEKDSGDQWVWINSDYEKNFEISPPPSVLYPTNQTTKLNPTFKWQPVEHATAYNLVILNSSGGEKFNTIVPVSKCNVNACSFSTNVINLANGSYTWMVRADMGVESYTDWGNATFTKIAPPAPKFPAISSTTPNPKFTWTPAAGQTRYQIELRNAAGALLRTMTLDTSVCTSTLCSYIPNPALILKNGVSYKWKVRAGDAVEWGTYSAFKTFNKVAPPAPVSPTGTITATNPKFTWKKIPGATKYYIVLQKSSGVLVKNMEVKTFTCNALNCWYTPNPVLNLAKGDYKWKVRAYNGYYGWYSGYKLFTRK